MKNNRTIKGIPARQGGFTLIELVIGITILGILIYGLMSALSGGNDSKVTALFSRSDDMVKATNLFKARTGCMPVAGNMDVLFSQPQALLAGTTTCPTGATAATYGTDNYISPLPVTGGGPTGTLMLDGLGITGGTIDIATNFGGGSNQNYYIKIAALPTDVARQLMTKCTGKDYSALPFPTDFSASVCGGTVGAATSEVDMLISKY